MAIRVEIPFHQLVVESEPLSQASFFTFGTVIENPAPLVVPSSELTQLPPNTVQANQGSALKVLDVTHMTDLYDVAPSHVQAKAVMNMFICAPRCLLRPSPNSGDYFPVKILERHPYTTQTFIPLGISPAEARQARYLVIVAPSLPPSTADNHLPVPTSIANRNLPGRGLPDLKNLKAFIANGSQAVTYGAGTWHAPMVVIGTRPIEFVVVQFANGVGIEDCQEVELGEKEGGGIFVSVPKPELAYSRGLWKL
jgi:ureidoglycolate lyase